MKPNTEHRTPKTVKPGRPLGAKTKERVSTRALTKPATCPCGSADLKNCRTVHQGTTDGVVDGQRYVAWQQQTADCGRCGRALTVTHYTLE